MNLSVDICISYFSITEILYPGYRRKALGLLVQRDKSPSPLRCGSITEHLSMAAGTAESSHFKPQTSASTL